MMDHLVQNNKTTKTLMVTIHIALNTNNKLMNMNKMKTHIILKLTYISPKKIIKIINTYKRNNSQSKNDKNRRKKKNQKLNNKKRKNKCYKKNSKR